MPTPVPYRLLTPLCIVYFIEGFAFTSLFSYVGFMVADFHLTDDPDMVGRYAGYIGSCFSAASFLSSFFFGKLSDKYGRRPMLLIGSTGNLISTLIFGFSTNLWMAVISRSAAGFLNGNIGVVKSYAADITDKTNQVKSFSLMQLSWGMGNILGPTIGGLVARPCSNYHGLCSADSLFGRYPYLLPNLIPAFVTLVGIITLYKALPKNEKSRYVEMDKLKAKNSDFSITDDASDDVISDDAMSDNGSVMSDSSGEMSPDMSTRLVHKTETEDEGEEETFERPTSPDDVIMTAKKSNMWTRLFARFKSQRQYNKLEKDGKVSTRDILFKNKWAMTTSVQYALLGAAFTLYDEAFPLWAMADYDKGGINASTKTIGLVGTINGVAAVVIQLTIFTPLAHRLGFVNVFRVGTAVGLVLFVVFPSLNLFTGNTAALWAVMAVFIFFKVFTGQFAFTAINALISNSTPLSYVGSVNGFAQSLVALTRAISPAVGGWLISWGLQHHKNPFPFNYYAVFVIMTLLMGSLFVSSWFLPKSLNAPYDDSASMKFSAYKEDVDEEREDHKMNEIMVH